MIALDTESPILARLARELDAQGPDPIGAARPELARATPEDVEAAQFAWSNRVIGEFRGVVIYTELLALLAEIEAPYAALAAVQRVIGDELRHTRICAAVVEWLGGWASLEVDLAGQRMPRWDAPAGARALQITARELVVVEEAAVRTFRAHLRADLDPAIRAVIEALLTDEIRHEATGTALRALLEHRYPEAREGLAERLEGDRRHLLEEALRRADDGPGRALGASLRQSDLEATLPALRPRDAAG